MATPQDPEPQPEPEQPDEPGEEQPVGRQYVMQAETGRFDGLVGAA